MQPNSKRAGTSPAVCGRLGAEVRGMLSGCGRYMLVGKWVPMTQFHIVTPTGIYVHAAIFSEELDSFPRVLCHTR